MSLLGPLRRFSLCHHGPTAVLRELWKQHRLIAHLSRREFQARYRGSILGVAWVVITPLFTLSIYTFVFSVVFRAGWDLGRGGRTGFAMTLFAGLIVYQMFAECVARAPTLMLENTSYIKKIVFPLEALAWVSLAVPLANAAIAVGVLLVGHSLLIGPPPLTAILLPLVILPLILFTVGIVWALAAIGVYLRDIRQVTALILQLVMFASPVFYPITAVPEPYRGLMYLNPLAVPIQMARDVLLNGVLPDIGLALLYGVLGWIAAWLGLLWFTLLKKGFADVA